MNHKPTRAEFEANVRMKGEGPSKADLAKLYPDLFGSKTKKKKPAAKPVSDPVQTPEPDISPTEALFGPESSGTAPGALHNAQDEAMLFYEDDDDES